MTVKDLLQLCGEKEETEVALYECDEREEVIGFAKTFLTDLREGRIGRITLEDPEPPSKGN